MSDFFASIIVSLVIMASCLFYTAVLMILYLWLASVMPFGGLVAFILMIIGVALFIEPNKRL